MADETPTPQKLDIDWLKTAAGALAAVSSAVLLSTLGAAGTLIGAAVGSVAATVGTALYSEGLARSRAAAAKAQEAALSKVGIAQAEVRRAGRSDADTAAVEAHLGHADEKLAEAKAGLDEAVLESRTGWRDRLAGLPWKRIAILAAGIFLVVMVALSLFEVVSGRSVSSYTGGSDRDGGTTISRLTGGSSSGDDEPTRDPGQGSDPSGASTPTADPTAEPTDDPTAEPSDEVTDEPTEEPTDEPTEEPTTVPSTTPTPSAVPTPTPTS